LDLGIREEGVFVPEKLWEVNDMPGRRPYPACILLIILLLAVAHPIPVRARMGLLGHCDFGIHQVQRSVEDIQFYSDCFDPYSWIIYQGESISSHPATRHFWLFLQLSSDRIDEALARAGEMSQDLENVLGRTEDQEDGDQRILLIQHALKRYGQDVSAKGDYFEIVISYDPLAPNPNPLADFQSAHAEACYFYVLLVYNLEMTEAVDVTWSDFTVSAFLSSFTASPGNREVILEWTTEIERQNLGFHILRREAWQDSFLPLTNRLIPSAADGHSQSPQQYRWTDRQVVAGETYQYQLQDINYDGRGTIYGPVTAVPLAGEAQPREFQLFQNYPNPFNATTRLCYDLSSPSEVSIRIYDVRGELVKVLVAEHRQAGQHTVSWDGCSENGQFVGSGLYVCSFEAQGYRQIVKMVLLR
jgi:hypothetical protein